MSTPASPLTASGCTANTETLCGCCAGTEAQTPQAITNRPALSSIAYRAGTWASFNASMLAALSDPDYPILQLLRTRDTSDFTIALLDSWAVALDILTFYQERFANEAFLRTAVDQRSVFELARLVGYVPSPGVAASAVLAYTLSSAPGSPDNVPIPAGTRVQSVPGPGQTPQVFESASGVTATIAFNAMPAQATQPWQLFGNDASTWIAGTTNNINVGDALLFITTEAPQPYLPGLCEVHYVTAVNINTSAGNTQITWDQPLSGQFAAGNNAQQITIYAFGKKAALYGAQAPNPLLMGTTQSNPNLTNILGYPSTSSIGVGSDWNFIYASGSCQINLDASYAGLASPSSGPPSLIVLNVVLGGTVYPFAFQITTAFDTNPNSYGLTTKTTQVTLTWAQNFPGYGSSTLDGILSPIVLLTRNVTAYVQSVPLTGANLPLTAPAISIVVAGQTITCSLAPGMLIPVQGASLAVVGGQLIA
jgi:hypothetical protein